MNPMIQHAARVLEHQPTRSMEAETLYRRTAREAGSTLSYARFVEALQSRTDDFAVIPADPVAGMSDAWDARHRTMYEAALESAGLSEPLIVLREQYVPTLPEHEPLVPDALHDVQDSLMHLMLSADPDGSLYRAVIMAIDELRAVRRVLGHDRHADARR